MSRMKLYCLPGNDATARAGVILMGSGVDITTQMEPGVTHWLAPIPTIIRPDPPAGVTLIGGNLPGAGIDLLKDPFYLAGNAAITARCALRLINKELNGLPVLILGWGRIGKCLGKFLTEAGAQVTIAARNAADVAMIQALGCEGIFLNQTTSQLDRFGAVINTIPAMVLPSTQVREDCVLLELASKPGLAGSHIIDGRGLPGKYAPEESGQLIARTILRLCKEELQ